ncbi:hypothetical protein [Streptomyces sp. MP131-18]|uniref:hypothetical protein n=1 Tax=Streptomyces sp. MP131-18 TaxID=1857892 RepID=UPI00097C05EB|nr:hypothetical protein [Streptomyces sp. MP131-18]ONK13123.1 hypothetical protein STBA_38850 [Streptomyces sp. MP131-18]
MPAAPGQRAGQRPQRAAVAAQRALGRAALGDGAMAAVMTVRLGGRWWRVTHDQFGQAWWESRETGQRCADGPCDEQEV